jgi:hypothetical protein
VRHVGIEYGDGGGEGEVDIKVLKEVEVKEVCIEGVRREERAVLNCVRII